MLQLLEWALSSTARRSSSHLHPDCAVTPPRRRVIFLQLWARSAFVWYRARFPTETWSFWTGCATHGYCPAIEKKTDNSQISPHLEIDLVGDYVNCQLGCVLKWALSSPAQRASLRPDCAFTPPVAESFFYISTRLQYNNCFCGHSINFDARIIALQLYTSYYRIKARIVQIASSTIFTIENFQIMEEVQLAMVGVALCHLDLQKS